MLCVREGILSTVLATLHRGDGYIDENLTDETCMRCKDGARVRCSSLVCDGVSNSDYTGNSVGVGCGRAWQASGTVMGVCRRLWMASW